MGKKSKRNRSLNNSNNPQQQQQGRPRRLDDDIDDDDDDDDLEYDVQQRRMTHPSLRKSEEETKDNLRFQDPFVEEYGDNHDDDDDDVDDDEEANEEEWEDVDDDDDDEEDDDVDGDEVVAMKPSSSATRKKDKIKSRDKDDIEMEEVVQTWNPFSKEHQQMRQQHSNNNNEVLEMDPTAYKMYHAMQNEWPSLSFDFIYDTYGIARTKFPHTIVCVCGTQADAADRNHITILKISDLHRIHIDTDDDILGEEIDNNNDDDDEENNDDDDDDDDIDDEEVEPVMEHYTIQHYGGVNRIRVMKQHYNSNIVASWSDTGTVHLYNIQTVRERFLESNGGSGTTTSNNSNNSTTMGMTNATSSQKPFYSYTNEDSGVEGFALDWSPMIAGRLATGDCHGSIHLWTPTSSDSGSSYNVSYLYNNRSTTVTPIHSVEDVQWSPTEATVLAAASSDGSVRIFDIRKPGHVMIGHHIHDADVNVLSWNPLVTNLLATGGDDGTLAVWDLRHFTNNHSSSSSKTTTTTAKATIQPLARFTPHTTPITSVEWHPTDESMLVASDDVGTYIYDLSVEEDDTTGTNNHSQHATTIDNNSNTVVVPPQLLFVHNGSEQFKEVHWHPQITSCVMTTALTGLSVFIPSNL